MFFSVCASQAVLNILHKTQWCTTHQYQSAPLWLWIQFLGCETFWGHFSTYTLWRVIFLPLQFNYSTHSETCRGPLSSEAASGELCLFAVASSACCWWRTLEIGLFLRVFRLNNHLVIDTDSLINCMVTGILNMVLVNLFFCLVFMVKPQYFSLIFLTLVEMFKSNQITIKSLYFQPVYTGWDLSSTLNELLLWANVCSRCFCWIPN